jgi:hypothetical protein
LPCASGIFNVLAAQAVAELLSLGRLALQHVFDALKRLFRPRRPQPLPVGPPLPDLPSWSEVPRDFVIDLSAVRSRDDFMHAMASHFPVGPDHDNLWGPIFRTIGYQACPFRLRFIGWDGFAQRMPRYARRLRRYLAEYQRRHGEERLHVDYAA